MLKYPGNWSLFRSDDRLLLIVFAVIVGICSGIAALLLNRGLESMLEWLHHYRIYWWAVFLPGVGAALSSLFLDKIVNEGAGHGVPEVIYAVSRYGGLLRLRSSFSRLISSCLTIGSGGSAGPEAPVVMSGAAIGSNIAQAFSLNDRQRVALVGCGAAGAIAAIFNAPISGMVFAVEVVLGEWSTMNIIPIAIAAVAGTEISRMLKGNQIVFAHRDFNIQFNDILACVGLAIFCAVASILLTRVLRTLHHASTHVSVPVWVRAFMGGSMVGCIGYFLPYVLGEGYHSIRSAIEGGFPAGLLLVTGITLVKIVVTSLTLGWGGSGGIFAPCLVIGAFVGLSFHRLIATIWPSVLWVNEGCFALLGMAGLISGILQAPLTGIFLIIEITGGYEVILPLIVVSAIATTLCHYIEPASFYLKDLVEQGQLLRPGTDARVLTDLSIEELLETDCISVHPDMRLAEFIDIVKASHRNYFPVEDRRNGRFLGMIQLDDIRPYLFDSAMHHAVLTGQLMNTRIKTASLYDDLADVLQKMDDGRFFSMPVVSDGRFQGMISKATLLDRYRKELMVQTGRT
ncbi:chloride channel protein [Desulfosarcina ovata]|uniref:Chloride channel protein n=2 Tax=Desulfosarcina ovata TaxID=83564 RepID=A0A5K8A8W3_9BACT|nr:chloride channel protein [Desulfosarcina ovata]BBO81671.1 chloride channel protein [Desulfosarcina ovata subsp. sediminis]BBO88906.1 chloride channel protein [Desulfosarcina ovata subsp. ovata]